MTKMVENQRDWDTFKITDKVGVICTYFTEQFLEESFKIVKLTPENFQEEIELNGLKTIFIDNDIYETDHVWFKRDRSDLFRYFRNENRRHFSKDIVVIKNSEMNIGSIFRNSYVLDIDSEIDNYFYQKYQFKLPLQINYQRINPSIGQNKKTNNVVNLSFGNKNTDLSFLKNDDTNVKNVKIRDLSRKKIDDLVLDIINSKTLYINVTEYVDSKLLKYIETVAALSSTQIIINNLSSEDNEYSNEANIQYQKKDDYNLWIDILSNQRYEFIKHTSILTGSFKQFMETRNTSEKKPKVSIITITKHKNMIDRYFKQMNNQEHVLLDINLVLDGITLSDSEKRKYQTESPFKINFLELGDRSTLGQNLNKAVLHAESNYIAKIDDDDYYGRNYIIDLWLSLKYSNANLVGKADAMYYFEEDESAYISRDNPFFSFTGSVNGSTIFTYKKLLEKIPFANISRSVEKNLFRRFVINSLTVFSTHPFGMCVLRKSDKTEHLLQVDDIILKNRLNELGFSTPKKYIDI